ncbi:energy transducer TonB [Flavobacterium bizetiae]|uniref:energy transducer TonB n=1 Tax=Flavobacterium bizetiae TaxID=2704140 RepID=UPI0021E93E2E|nr:energy transducer TonB [Flavobacterium bizetiae]UTN05826.1 energy transducer TonB [Flavobacterium bizetiae]
MERNFKITIPKPCHEDWNKMTPSDNGRFCLSCSKTVVDFTSMLPDEVQHFFIQNQNTNICGRFKKSQLDTITIQIPSRVLYTQTHYHKMFLLALFIAMGTTLFSCADKDGNKKKIDKVEIIQNDPTTEHISVGDTKISNSNTPLLPPPPPPKIDQVKFVKGKARIKNAKLVKPVPINCPEIIYEESLSKRKDKIAKDSIVENEIYFMGAAIETMPSFPNGVDNFYQLFINEFKRPEETKNLNNRIIVSFVIEKDGSLSSFDFSKNTNPEIKTEITRALKTLPNWVPGTQNGKKTRTKYSMPIAFEKDSSENSKQ